MRSAALLFFLMMCCIVILSCDDLAPKKFEFYYYPSRNIYFDVANNLYLYSLNGGKTWDSLNAATGKEPVTLGNKQIIYSTTPDILASNETYLKQYNGHVIDINTGDSSVIKKDLVAERKIKKTKPAPMTDSIKKPEKKPGFFKRLFGKKNR